MNHNHGPDGKFCAKAAPAPRHPNSNPLYFPPAPAIKIIYDDSGDLCLPSFCWGLILGAAGLLLLLAALP
jgi:hypothetical protein